ncbi:GMC oxidoreductase-domain-containing protein [Mycena rosella]|uniref:GMC oxidoreductase-domain-containing protein n=1 Tax=Mycena rosella TaxID=1033263 RepID=A0AAD7DV39_MYCRO|nr:GMC oxidoreductase-domain-containing protein [Mycena rosella]
MESSAIDAFISTSFDYIVIGASHEADKMVEALRAWRLQIGECFTQCIRDYPNTTFTRLSEDSNIKIGILEAGLLHENDPLIDVPGQFKPQITKMKPRLLISTAPQTGAAGRSLPVVRGKVLGGSSALNFMAWHRGSREEYDAWKLVADSEGGWDWNSLLPFFRKTEDTAPASVSRDLIIDYSTSEANVFSHGIAHESAVAVGGPLKHVEHRRVASACQGLE